MKLHSGNGIHCFIGEEYSNEVPCGIEFMIRRSKHFFYLFAWELSDIVYIPRNELEGSSLLTKMEEEADKSGPTEFTIYAELEKALNEETTIDKDFTSDSGDSLRQTISFICIGKNNIDCLLGITTVLDSFRLLPDTRKNILKSVCALEGISSF